MSNLDQEPNRDSAPSPASPGPSEGFSWDDDRSEERRRRAGGTGAWIGGAILILLGVIFLLQNVGILFLENWWALFILIPAVGAYAAAWENYRRNGRLTRQAGGSLIGGLFFTALTLILLLELDLGQAWPFLLIGAGLIVLVSALLPD